MPGGKIDILVEPDLKGFGSKLGRGLNSLSGIASTAGKAIGIAVAGGTAIAAIGFKDVISLGIEYQGKLNELQAVSNSTGVQMAAVGAKAKELGADLSLPATSAAGAAAAMLELAKGGLSVDQAMQAAKGTLQLAAAAQIDAAAAAEIQSNALNQFGLSAGEAGRVADVLANTANAASGSIGDIALALKYVGPVAKSVGVSIGDTATAIGLLANKGIQADQAGTSLRAMLAGLAAPSKPAAKALNQLGVEAFDSSGKFVGFRAVIDQLSTAQKRMTQEQFASAAATAFGREPLAAIVALAESGAPAFDEMATAVNRQGGAADVAAAKMKGLGGAWEGFKSQLETAGISIFESIDGPLENIVRKGSDFVEKFTPAVKRGLDGAIAAGTLFGPDLARAIGSRADALKDVAVSLLGPLVQGLKEAANKGFAVVIASVQNFADVVHQGVDAVQPLAEGIGHVIESFSRADGPIGAFGAALGIAYDIVKGLIGIVSPVISLVANLVSGFADLPGPIQAAALAILALKVGPSILSSLKGAFSGAGKDADDAAAKTGLFGKAVGLVAAPVKLVASGLSSAAGTVRQFAGEMDVQRSLAAASGAEMGKLGASVQAFHTSTIPAVAAVRNFAEQTASIRSGAAAAGEPISRMGAAIGTLVERSSTLSAARDAFNSASEGADRFGRTAGTAAAAGSLLKSAGSGIVGALGGPFGIVLAGATLGLGLLAGKQEEAARKAEQHKRDVATLADALRESNGAIDDHIRKMQAEALQSDGVADAFKEQGVSLTTLTAATLKQGVEYDNLHQKLENIALANSDLVADPESGNVTRQFNERGKAAQELIKVLEDYGAKTDAARQKQKELDAAIKNGTASALEATDSGRTFADAMGTLADRTASADDKARALKVALDALSGGQVSLEAAQARVNEQFDRLGDAFDKDVDKSKGFGASLLTSSGHINTANENGRHLRDSLDEIATSSVEVAQKQFDMTGSLTDAQKVVQGSRDRFIAMADTMGLSRDQAGKLADQMGLIPEQVVTLIQTPGMPESQREMILLQGLIERTPGKKDVVVRSLTDDAKRQLEDFGFKVTSLPDGQISVHADTEQATRNLNNWIAANNGKAIHIFADIVGPARNMVGGRVLNHDGNIIRAFANGGFAGLTPLKGGVATIVPPNTWRVVGDRIRDDEAYIPINQSTRSLQILQQTASQMGFALARRFAAGGVAVPGTPQPQPDPAFASLRSGDTFNIFEQVDPVSTATEVQRRQSFQARLR